MIIPALAVAASETLLAFTEGVTCTVGLYAIVKGSKTVKKKRK